MPAPDFRPRPDDDLVEPLFAALGEAAGSDTGEGAGGENAPGDTPEKEPSSGGRRGRILVLVALAGGLSLLLARLL